jgi:putative FmdB family regulatory protein
VPTYSYECGSCDHVFDVFHGMSAEPKIKCEKCAKKCRRLIGTGAGIIFKGSGFYETDFKEKKGKAPEKPQADKAKSENKDAAKPTKSGAGKKKASNG